MSVNVHQSVLNCELLERGLIRLATDRAMESDLKRYEVCLQRVAAGWPIGAAAEKSKLAPDAARTVSGLQVCYRTGPEGGPAGDKEHVTALWLAHTVWQNSTTSWSTRQNGSLREALRDDSYLDYLARRTLLVANKFAADDLLVLSCLQYHGVLPTPSDLAGTLAHPGSAPELDMLMHDLEQETGNAHGTYAYIVEDFRSAARRIRAQEPETFTVKGRKYALKYEDYRDSQSGRGCPLNERLALEAKRAAMENPHKVGEKAKSARSGRKQETSIASPRATGMRSVGALRRQLERERVRRERVEKELSATRRENMRLRKERLAERKRVQRAKLAAQKSRELENHAVSAARKQERATLAKAKEAERARIRAVREEEERRIREQKERAMTKPVKPLIVKFEPVDGIIPTKDFDIAFLRSQRERLVGTRAELLYQTNRLEQDAIEIVNNQAMGGVDFGEQSGEGDTMAMEREHTLILAEQVRPKVEAIDAALKRMEIGEYGYSSYSGLPLPRERLRAHPLATLLIVEQTVSHEAGTWGHA